jgi:tartrate-resistant acid phosphatase type 5
VFSSNLTDFRVLAGNHDHYGDVGAQIAYSRASQRWNYPALFYDFLEQANGTSVHVLMLDTVVLAGHSGHDASATGKTFNKHQAGHTLDGSELKGPSTVEHQDLAKQQWQWIESTLAASTADYIIVAGHYPVWSVCEHGPSAPLVERLKPLLDAHGVDAYLYGYDHCAQHIADPSGVEHHGVGAFHGCDDSTRHAGAVPPGSRRFHYGGRESGVEVVDFSRGAFARVTANASVLEVSHYNSDGALLYVAAPHPPRAKGPFGGLSGE